MPSFNNNPSAFVDLNNYFPVLNEKVGLSDEQFRLLVENTYYLLNHLGLADVDVGTITTKYGAPGSLANVSVTHREAIDPDTEKLTDYFDYEFTIPSPSISATGNATISQDQNENAKVVVTPTEIKNNDNVVIGYTFDFDFTIPRGIQGIQGVSLRNRGEYSETATYVNNDTYIDLVHYQGNVYAPNVEEVVGQLPTNISYFDLFVSRGERGNGITNIQKTKTEGLVDTYTISTTDGDNYTFTVTNGEKQDISGKEDIENKTSSISTQNQESETLYPNIKATVDYVDTKFGEMATLLSEV